MTRFVPLLLTTLVVLLSLGLFVTVQRNPSIRSKLAGFGLHPRTGTISGETDHAE